MELPGGCLDSITVAGPVPDNLRTDFFSRFEEVHNVFVVGTPGGVNCPMPGWLGVLAGLHMLAPVIYLTPQFTRGVRFPRAYVLSNPYWNDHIKRTVWDATLTCMARRPEIPVAFGNWGLMLRLNVANAIFCRDWYRDVMRSELEDVEPPARLASIVQAYVDRNSGFDRKPGAILQELRLIGVEVPELKESRGAPFSPRSGELVRSLYKKHLYIHTMACLLCADTLLMQNRGNFQPKKGAGGFETMQPRCGYVNPHNSLADLFGADDGIDMLRELPLQRLTPAYDVVAMMLVVSNIKGEGIADVGLVLEEADASMGLELLSEEAQGLSQHPILMVPQQHNDTVDDQVRRLSRIG